MTLRTEILAIYNRTSQGKFISIFKIITESKTTGQRGNLHAILRDLAINVERSGLPFHITAQAPSESKIASGDTRSATRATSWRMVISDGPTPLIGEIMPPST